MKKIITMLFLLMISMQLQAQDWNFGVKGGVNFASFTGSDADDFQIENRTGFHVGALTGFKFSPSVGAQLEVMYNTLGGKADLLLVDDLGNEIPGEATFKLEYISVPVLVQYFPLQDLSLETGPQISFETTSEVEAESEGEKISLGLEDETSSVDFAWVFGVGYELPYNLLLQGRYMLGLSDVYDETNMKHSVLQISVGLRF